METRVAAIAIIVEEPSSVEKLNALLHEHRDIIIGRMGIPYRAKGISVITLAVDGEQDEISALSGQVGALPGVSARAVFSR